MNKNLNHYIKVYPKFLSEDLCNKVVAEMDSVSWKNEHGYTASLDVSHDTSPSSKLVMDAIWYAYKQYVTDIDFEWFKDWRGYSPVRFNRYQVGKEFSLHCDHVPSFDGIPSMTCVGILNDAYEGGDLIFFEDTMINVSAGDVVVFPSNFLFPHRVTKVTKGVRYSFSSFAF
jgi:hypothetical protein